MWSMPWPMLSSRLTTRVKPSDRGKARASAVMWSWSSAIARTTNSIEAGSLPELQSSCFRGFTRNRREMDSPSRVRTPPALSGARESPIDTGAPRAVVARRSTYPAGHHVDAHWHDRAQFIFAVQGTMRVRTPRRAWIVPPSRALWVPSHTVHEIQMYGVVEMRSVYIDDAAAAGMPSSCVVLNVTPLLRELVVRAVALPAHYDDEGDEGLLMKL